MSISSPVQANERGAAHPPSLLIRDCALLAPSPSGGLLPHQDILVAGTRIVALGPTGTLVTQERTLQTVSGAGCLAIPGLINAHTHSPENILKATVPALPLELWLIPLFANGVQWTPRLTYLSALLGAAEMLKTGTTALLDHLWTVEGVAWEYLDAAMSAYRDAGIRVGVAPSIEDQDLVLAAGVRAGLEFPDHFFIRRFSEWPSIDEQFGNLERFLETWHNRADGRLRCLPGPSGIHWCSSQLLERCQELAERFHTGLHLHAVETALQAHTIHAVLGKGGISFLKEEGILRPGTSLAHAIWLDPGDLDVLAETGTTVVHNPVSNLRLGSGRFPLIEARKKGVQVALGSDGSASNDTQNMFGVLKLTGLVHNQPDEDYEDWPAASEILALATIGGAAALGLGDELGRLAPGQLADVVLLKLNTEAFTPLRDPMLHLIYCETGHSVDTVIVNGQVLKVVDTQTRSRPSGIPPQISDPLALARELYGRGEWQRVHIIDRCHLAWVAQQAQATPRRDLTLDAYYHLVYSLVWGSANGYVCLPPHPGSWHGWTYMQIRRFIAGLPSPATLALGVYADHALSIGLILVCEGGMIRRVTTFEALTWAVSHPGPTQQTLTALCEALEAQFAPPAAILLCTEAVFSGWLAAADKRAYLAEARASSAAIWYMYPLREIAF